MGLSHGLLHLSLFYFFRMSLGGVNKKCHPFLTKEMAWIVE